MNVKKDHPKVKTIGHGTGMAVKTGLKAGAWVCKDCAGEAMGSSLFKPTCGFCQLQ